MKKKLLLMFMALVTCFTLMACGGEPEPQITIDDVTAAVQTVDPDFVFDGKPFYQMISADDGWIGYLYVGETRYVVKVYQYLDDKTYEEAVEGFDIMEPWPKVGQFVLECDNPDVQAAFLALGAK